MTANVGVDCDITTTPMTFPDTGLLDRMLSTTNQVTVTCTQGTAFYIELDSGNDKIDYQLYMSSQRTLIWGDGTGGTEKIGSYGSGSEQTYTVYGLVPHRRSSPRGITRM